MSASTLLALVENKFRSAPSLGTIDRRQKMPSSLVLQNTGGNVRFPRRGSPPATTMTKDDIQLLYEYDRWANNRVLQAVSTLSAEEFTRDLGGSLGSVRATLVHM